MSWFKDLEGDCVVGSIVPSPVPFVYDRSTGTLILGEQVGGGPDRLPSPEEAEAVAAAVAEALRRGGSSTGAAAERSLPSDGAAQGPSATMAVDAVRVGEYRCGVCGEWVPVTPSRWSYGICLSCSLDRDSDRWSDR